MTMRETIVKYFEEINESLGALTSGRFRVGDPERHADRLLEAIGWDDAPTKAYDDGYRDGLEAAAQEAQDHAGLHWDDK